MTSRKSDLIMHPVRMRIIQTLVGRMLTAGEIGDELPDVPQATLYRHVRALHEGGVLCIAAERPVRSVVEKVYSLNTEAAMIRQEDLNSATPDDMMQMLQTFVASLLADFERYLGNPQHDFRRDNVAFIQAPITASDEEMKELADGIRKLVEPLIVNPPSEGRKRHLVNLIMMPKSGAEPKE